MQNDQSIRPQQHPIQQEQIVNLNQIFEKIREYIQNDQIDELKKIILQYEWIVYQPIDANNLTMLHYAVQFNRKRIVEELSSIMFEKGNVNVVDNFKRTPLHQAAGKGDLAIIKTLILVSGDVNARTISGETPVMKAISFYQAKAVKLLLRFGANPFLKNFLTGKNAFELSKQMNNTDIIEIVQRYEDIYKKIALILYIYTTFPNTEKKCIINKLDVRILKKLIKYIIP